MTVERSKDDLMSGKNMLGEKIENGVDKRMFLWYNIYGNKSSFLSQKGRTNVLYFIRSRK